MLNLFALRMRKINKINIRTYSLNSCADNLAVNATYSFNMKSFIIRAIIQLSMI